MQKGYKSEVGAYRKDSFMKDIISIDNKQIELLDIGAGKHTLIIQTGMYCSFYEWLEIINNISLYNRVIIYHRPGYGNSELGSEQRTTKQTVRELSELLKVLQIEDPIILIGHSYGGLCAQHFTKVHPNKVASLLLIDSTSVNLHMLDELDLPVSDEQNSDKVWVEKCQKYSRMNSDELKKKLNIELSKEQMKLPENIRDGILEFNINPNLYKAVLSEINNWYDDALEIKAMGDFPNIPLQILARDPKYSMELQIDEGIPYEEAKIFEDTWNYLIWEQANLSNKSEFHIVDKASHSIHLDKPEVVINTIRELIRNFT